VGTNYAVELRMDDTACFLCDSVSSAGIGEQVSIMTYDFCHENLALPLRLMLASQNHRTKPRCKNPNYKRNYPTTAAIKTALSIARGRLKVQPLSFLLATGVYGLRVMPVFSQLSA